MMPRRALAALLLIATPLMARAAEQAREPLVVMAERRLPSGREQVALTIHPDHLELTLNSNFLSEPSRKAALGKFRSAHSIESQAAMAILQQFAQRYKDAPSPSGSAHGTKWYLGRRRLQKGTPVFEEAGRLLIQAIREIDGGAPGWSMTDGVRIGPEIAATCKEPSQKKRFCEIPGFGSVYLLR